MNEVETIYILRFLGDKEIESLKFCFKCLKGLQPFKNVTTFLFFLNSNLILCISNLEIEIYFSKPEFNLAEELNEGFMSKLMVFS